MQLKIAGVKHPGREMEDVECEDVYTEITAGTGEGTAAAIPV